MGPDTLCIYIYKDYKGVQLLVGHDMVTELDTLQFIYVSHKDSTILYL
jgi:hypothetical protein